MEQFKSCRDLFDPSRTVLGPSSIRGLHGWLQNITYQPAHPSSPEGSEGPGVSLSSSLSLRLLADGDASLPASGQHQPLMAN